MFFESSQANLLVYLSISTLVLWIGPSHLLPGYTATLPLATTAQGQARGEVWTSRDGRAFSVWRGLPYAKPPVGARRFRRPEALDSEDSWRGERTFQAEMPRCYQLSLVGGFHMGQEDCLYLNVYTPVTSDNTLLPVMVYIHGGGFVAGEGGSTIYGPHFLMDEGVVVVSLQYRLGILGFLSTEEEDAPGNLGLWDQREALLWVRNNIAALGGDPGQVTLFGESAGSMSVNFHLVSPQSRGLFHRAILQSGTAISPYTAPRRSPAAYAGELAAAAGCGDKDTLSCLRALPARKLYLHLSLFQSCSVRQDLGIIYPAPWVPWVDAHLKEPFLPKDPLSVLEGGEDASVPVLLGFNSEEGLLYTGRFTSDPAFHARFLAHWDTCGPINFLGRDKAEVTEEDLSKVTSLRAGYADDMAGLTDMFTDAIFASSTHHLARLLTSNGRTVYKYMFTYRGSFSLTDLAFSGHLSSITTILRALFRLPSGPVQGTGHGDELIYIFQTTPVLQMLPKESDVTISRSLVSWWAAFAKGGPPDPAWVPATEGGDYSYWVVGGQGGIQDRRELARLENWLQ